MKNIIIAGVPRSGTTSLFKYLSSHPDVTPTKYIEGCYFIDKNYYSKHYNQRLLPKYYEGGIDGYKEIFEKPQSSTQFYLDSSPDYLYQNDFLDSLQKFQNQPYLIVVLRNPVKRIHSMFEFSKGKLARLPKDMSFSKFIDLVNNRSSELKDLVNLREIIEHSNYVKHLSKLTRIFPRKNLLIITHDEFVQDTSSVINMICNKVGLDDHYYKDFDFKIHNSSAALRFPILQRIYNTLPIPHNLRYGESQFKKILRGIYRKFNYQEKDELNLTDEKIFKNIKETLMPSMNQLSEEFNVDVTPWINEK